MELRYLITNSLINETSRCGIHNSLLKFRPDLADEITRVKGRNVSSSTAFLKKHGLWDDDAVKYLHAFHHWQGVHLDGPDEWSTKKMNDALEQLMCHVARLIRQSSIKESTDPALQFSRQLLQKYRDLGLKTIRMNVDTRHPDPVVELSDIWIDPEVQGKGVGSQVMQEITQWADQNGALIWLSLGDKDQGRGTTSQARLRRFYKQFGFKPNKGRGKRFDLSMYAQMYRPAS